jgi:hypothetical protein
MTLSSIFLGIAYPPARVGRLDRGFNIRSVATYWKGILEAYFKVKPYF